MESAIQEERNKSIKLQKRLYSLSQNQVHIQVNQSKKRNRSSKSFHLDEEINKELDFPYYISDQKCIKTNRYINYLKYINLLCININLIASSLVLKCNPTNKKDVQKALNLGRFL